MYWYDLNTYFFPIFTVSSPCSKWHCAKKPLSTSWHSGDNQRVRSSVLVVSKRLWPGNGTFLEVAIMVAIRCIVAFLRSVEICFYEPTIVTKLCNSLKASEERFSVLCCPLNTGLSSLLVSEHVIHCQCIHGICNTGKSLCLIPKSETLDQYLVDWRVMFNRITHDGKCVSRQYFNPRVKV